MLARLSALSARLSAAVSARPRVWWSAVGVLVALVLTATVVLYLHKIGKPDRNGDYTKSAFLRWRPQIEKLDRGVDIYAVDNYPNPPIMALVLKPFMALPPTAGAVTWLLLKAAMAAVMFAWAVRLATEPGRTFPPIAALFVGLLALHPVLGDLQHGNVNIFIAFLVFASLEFFRRGWDTPAGVVLALAIACKVTPALFVVYFGWKAVHGGWAAWRAKRPVVVRAWESGGKVLLGCVAGLVLWLVVVPGLYLGFDRNAALLQSWYATMVKPFVQGGRVQSEVANQSLPGLAHGFFTAVPLPEDEADEDDGKPSKRRGTLADLGPPAAGWMVRGCQGAFVLAVVLLARCPVGVRRQGVWFAAECGFILLGMLLFSERTWKHHATTTAIPMAALVGCWVFGRGGWGVRAYLLGTLVAAVLLMTGPSALAAWDEDFQDVCLNAGTHAAAWVLLTVALGVVMRVRSREPRASASGR
jgi:hypothetical protein